MSPAKRWLRSTAHVAGLWALVVAAPLLDALARSPEFFTAHRASGIDLLLLAGGLVLVGPLVAGGVLALASLLGARIADVTAATLVGAIASAYAVQAAYRLGVATWPPALLVATAAFAVAALAWWRARVVRFVLTVLSLASIGVPALFFTHSSVRALFRQSGPAVPARHASTLPPVVLVVFDELPLVSLLDAQGRLDSVRFPHVAALAADGVWFRNATTVSDFTASAVPAILTGHYPRARLLPNAIDHPDNVFVRLAPTHRMQVVEPWTAICPRALCGAAAPPRSERIRRMGADVLIVLGHALLPRDLRGSLPDVTAGFGGFGDAARADGPMQGARPDAWQRAVSFVDGIDAHDQPAFYFLHSVISHHPPTRLPSGQAVANLVPPPGLQPPRLDWPDDEWQVTLFRQAMLAQDGAVDTIVGRLVARLRATGLYDRAVVVITADHGIGFVPGRSARDVDGPGAAGVVPVPFIVKLPAARQLLPPGTIDEGNVETVDVVPTIADAIGLSLDRSIEGVSAFARPGRQAPKRVFVDSIRRERTFDAVTIARERDAEAARQAELFGSAWWPSPSPPGLRPLLGRRLATLSFPSDASAGIAIDRPDALASVNLDAPALPVQVTGTVSNAGVDAVRLALALNGEVVAVTRTWGADHRWMALLPPNRLRRGRNDLRVLLVDATTTAQPR